MKCRQGLDWQEKELPGHLRSNFRHFPWTEQNKTKIKEKKRDVSDALRCLTSDEMTERARITTKTGIRTSPTKGSGSNLSQASGATFRVIIDTKDWDNSLATNSPGQSGNPLSPFYRNLYEDWANDKYFNLFYSKEKIKSNLHSREIYYPN